MNDSQKCQRNIESNSELIAELVEAIEQLLSRVVEKDTWDKKAILVAKAALRKAKEWEKNHSRES